MEKFFCSHPVQGLICYLDLYEAFNFRMVSRFCCRQTKVAVRISVKFSSWDWAIKLRSIYPNIKLHAFNLTALTENKDLPLIQSFRHLKNEFFPDEKFFMNQTKLKAICIDSINLKIPHQIFPHLTNLCYLHIDIWNISHEDLDKASLWSLSNLTTLTLNSSTPTGIKSLTWLNLCTNLFELSLYLPGLKEISIDRLTKLTKLQLFRGVNCDCILPNLEKLALSGHSPVLETHHLMMRRVRTLSVINLTVELGRLGNLEHLYVSNCKIALRYLNSMDRLISLSLCLQKDVDLNSLKALPCLEKLEITEGGYSDVDIGCLTNIRHLRLVRCHNLSLNCFERMGKLEILDVCESIDFLKGDIKNLMGLRGLVIKNLDDSCKEGILKLTNLTSLNCDGVVFSEGELGGLVRLKIFSGKKGRRDDYRKLMEKVRVVLS